MKPLVYYYENKEPQQFIHYMDVDKGRDLSFVQCGRHQTEPNYVYGPLIRDFFVIHFVMKGEGSLHLNDQTYHVRAGECFIIRPYQRASYQSSSEDAWTYQWLGFNGTMAQAFVEQAGFSEGQPVIPFDQERISPQLTSIVSDALDHLGDPIANDLLIGGKIRHLLYDMILVIEAQKNLGQVREEASPSGEYHSSEDYVHYVLRIIHMEYHQELKVEDIARKLNLNRSYLSSIFKDFTGSSIMQYLILYRLHEARILLTQTTLSVSEVAQAVGFNDLRNFSRRFKKEYGQTPRDYRRR